jgi:hypothetical protein
MVGRAVDVATKLRAPQNPNFLLGFGDPTNFMRLSLMKAAHAVLGGAAYRKFGSFAFLVKAGIRDIRKTENGIFSGKNSCLRFDFRSPRKPGWNGSK